MAEVSVVVPSAGRRAGVTAIAARVAGDTTDAEVVVVDNTPGGSLGPIDGARVVREPLPGAARARNRGAAAADGRVLVFVDDDVRVSGVTVRELSRPVLAGEAVAVVTRVRLDPAVALPRWLTPPLLGYLSNHDRGDRAHDVGYGDHGLSAAMAVDRQLFSSIGGFWERLGPRPGAHRTNDDVQLCRAIQRTGGTIRYVPAAAVVHAVPAERLRRRYVLRRAYQQGRSDWLLEHLWEGAPARRVLARTVADLGRSLAGTVRRIHRGPGTTMRAAAAIARSLGTLSAAVREPQG